MLDTIIYIPTILAYAFISLLVTILCFIVIYVSHKIYLSVYDNLPDTAASVSEVASGRKFRQPTKNGEGHWHNSHEDKKSKTALKIIVTHRSCYLAYVIFSVGLLGSKKSTSPSSPPSGLAPEQKRPMLQGPRNGNNTENNDNNSNANATQNTDTNNLDMGNASGSADDSNDNSTDHPMNNSQRYDGRRDNMNNAKVDDKLIKYYDRLSSIPHGKVMQACAGQQ